LTDIQWQQQSGTNIDYRDVPTTFTALAIYSRTATSTVVTGFVTTAEYHGTVTRIATDVTRYTAYFLGVPIISPLIVQPSTGTTIPKNGTENGEPNNSYLSNGENGINGENGDIYVCTDYEPDAENDKSTKNGYALLIVLIIILFLVNIGLIGFINKAWFIGFISRIKAGKPAAMLFMMLLVTQVAITNVYAAPPPYRFGAGQQAVHVNANRNATENSRERPGDFTIVAPATYQYGDFLGTLHVARLNRTVRVYAGATMEAMDNGAGHFSFTGLNTGNTGLVGHNRGSRNGFFNFVRLLQHGDIITLTANGTTRRYAVSMQYTINEDDFSPLLALGDNRLTLVTCVEYQPGLRRVAVATEI
jgi:LPXTG-site transpeptidase (sortase) family protein